ncbi:hypothetical protein G3A39_40810 [Paraburkholderia aspalathi]|nr:hypothetical protein [Paraburkholderia aspalathi]
MLKFMISPIWAILSLFTKFVPFWAAFFIITGIVYVLQVLPHIGFFMLLLGAPLWSIVTINAGFAAMAFDCAKGKLPEWLLLVPFIWFGGYYAAAAASYVQANQYEAQFVASNAGKSVAFDPDAQDLILEASARNIVSPEAILKDYEISPVFSEEPNPRCGPITSYSIWTERCGKGYTVVGESSPGCNISTNLISRYENGKYIRVAGVCIVDEARKPTKQRVRIGVSQTSTISTKLIESEIKTLAITPSGSNPTYVEMGYTRRLAWFPMPVLGCWPENGMSGWKCHAEFMKTGNKYFGDNAIMMALGLKQSPVEDRYSKSGRK